MLVAGVGSSVAFDLGLANAYADDVPRLTFDHRQGQSKPILWVADATAWAFGAGNRWMPLVEPAIEHVVELRP